MQRSWPPSAALPPLAVVPPPSALSGIQLLLTGAVDCEHCNRAQPVEPTIIHMVPINESKQQVSEIART